MTVPLFYHKDFSQFDFGQFHPFRGNRFSAFMTRFREMGLGSNGDFEIVEPPEATDQDLERVHSREYIKIVKMMEDRRGYLSPDTQVQPGMIHASRLIWGSAIEGTRMALRGRTDLALGFGGFHHAGVSSGEGFCLFNDVAGAARLAIDEFGVERVMILDTDAHQGNGTMEIFYKDPRVLFVSLHQDPGTIYPGKGFVEDTGELRGKGYTVNLCMPPMSGTLEYAAAFDRVVDPLAKQFRPQFIIRNGGSDPFWGDELTNLGLDMAGLTYVAERVREVSKRSGAPQLDLTASGYGRHVIEGWLALFRGTTGIDIDIKEPPMPMDMDEGRENVRDRTERMLDRLYGHLSDHWDV